MLFALDLIPAGEEYDEWRSVVHRACLRIRKSARRTPDGDMEAVMAAMRKPLVLTAEEIALEAGLPRRDVERILSAMLAAGAAVRRERGTLLPARGPKVWLYRLTG
jgi:predicted transcriptional regulator